MNAIHAACGCEWAGAFCPHCGRAKTSPLHVTRCHAAERGIPICLKHRKDQWGFCEVCGVDVIPLEKAGQR